MTEVLDVSKFEVIFPVSSPSKLVVESGMPDQAKSIDNTQASPLIQQTQASKPNSGDALSGLTRQLKDEDLSSPAVGKLLLYHNEKMVSDITQLKKFEEDYYKADKRAGVLAERIIGLTESITARGVLLSFGGILAGLLMSVREDKGLFATLAIIALVCFLVAILGFKVKNDED